MTQLNMTSSKRTWIKFCLFVSLITVLSLILASCSKPAETGDYDRLLEDAIDAEAHQYTLTAENQQLKQSADFYSQEFQNLMVEVEKTRIKDGVREIKAQDAPNDRIREDEIEVGKKRVIIDVEGIQLWYVEETGSMVPVIDAGSTVLAQPPSGPESVAVGDIIIYEDARQNIIHRVLNYSSDDFGLYYLTKGDNNPLPDEKKVRFRDIRAVVVGIIY